MNGRVYDYNLGRFMSVDPFIQSVGNSQSVNPYSYIMNNPLAGTDPTGYVGCAASRIQSVCEGFVYDSLTWEEKEQTQNQLSVGIGAIAYNGNQISDNEPGHMDIEGELEKATENSAGSGSTSILSGLSNLFTTKFSEWSNEGALEYHRKNYEEMTEKFGTPGGCESEDSCYDAEYAALYAQLTGTLLAYPPGQVPMTAAANAQTAIRTSSAGIERGFTVDPNKFNYFFGRVVTGKPHNILRSAQNLKDLRTLGITTEKQLMVVFQNALSNGRVVSEQTSKYGLSVIRSIDVGNKGALQVSFFYQGGNVALKPSVVTIIPKIYK